METSALSIIAVALTIWILFPKSDRKTVASNISGTVVDSTSTIRKTLQYSNDELDHARAVGKVEKIGEFKKAKADADYDTNDQADYEAMIAELNGVELPASTKDAK